MARLLFTVKILQFTYSWCCLGHYENHTSLSIGSMYGLLALSMTACVWFWQQIWLIISLFKLKDTKIKHKDKRENLLIAECGLVDSIKFLLSLFCRNYHHIFSLFSDHQNIFLIRMYSYVMWFEYRIPKFHSIVISCWKKIHVFLSLGTN